METRLKNILKIITIVVLALLTIQTTWHPFEYLQLKNDPKNAPKPELSFKNYCNGDYQKQVDDYLRENYATRAICIRTHNEYRYDFFNKETCNSFFFPGKDNWMYYRPGVLDYYGQEAPKFFKSNEELKQYFDNQLDDLNELRSILKNDYGIELLSFVAPDKPFIYPEHLPKMERDTSLLHGASYYSERAKEIGFPNINMIPWYAAIADTSSRNLFMPMDSHWTYAAVYGYDSLFRFMDSLNDFGIPKMKIGKINEQKYIGRQDDEATLNLLFKLRNDTPKYTAEVSVIAGSTSRKPRVLFVGDSFIFAFEWMKVKKDLISYYENWFYYDKVYKGLDKKQYSINEINKLRSVLNVDYVVLYYVGYQWYTQPRAFIADILSSIKDPEQVEVALMMNHIESDPEWMKIITEKAENNNISVEKQLELDAKWMIEHKN